MISRQEQSASSISVFEGSNNRHLNSEAAKRASSAQEARFSFVPRTSKWNRPAQGHWDFRWTPELTRRFSESKRRQRKPPFEIHTPQTQAQLRIPDREGHLSPRETQRHQGPRYPSDTPRSTDPLRRVFRQLGSGSDAGPDVGYVPTRNM